MTETTINPSLDAVLAGHALADERANDEPFWLARLLRNVDRFLETTSPSQITAYEECPRRWGGGWLYGWKGPSTAAQTRGSAIHTEVEHYLTTGTIRPSEWDKLVACAAPHYPAPGPTTQVEQWIEIPTRGGPKVRGRFDVRCVANVEEPIVIDTKTSSDIRRYAKKPDELAEHVQGNVYARATLTEYPTARNVRFRLVYLQTRGRAASAPVEALLNWTQIMARWHKTLASVGAMVSIANAARAGGSVDLSTFLSIAPNVESCNLYGGCDYRAVCGEGGQAALVQLRTRALAADVGKAPPTSPAFREPRTYTAEETQRLAVQSQIIDPMFNTTPERIPPMSLLSSLPPVTHAPAAPAPAPAPAPTPVASALPPKPTPTPAVPTPTGRVACSSCEGKRYVKNPAANALPGSFVACGACKGTGFGAVTIRVEGADGKMYPIDSAEAQAIVPPDAPARTSTPEEVAAANAPAEKKARKPRAPKGETPPAEHVIPPPPMGPHTTPDEAPAEPVASAPTFVAVQPIRAGEVVAVARRVVYVDCMPTKGPNRADAVHYEEWLAPIAARVAAENTDDNGKPAPVLDWRLIPYRAEGSLVVGIRAAIKREELPRVVIVSGMSRARDAFLEAVTPIADEIVRKI